MLKYFSFSNPDEAEDTKRRKKKSLLIQLFLKYVVKWNENLNKNVPEKH